WYAPEFQVYQVLSSAGASILGLGFAIPVIYFLWSLRYGERAGANPWRAVGLEWMIGSPPPTENFATVPVVTWEAYEYSDADAEEHDKDLAVMPGKVPGAPVDEPVGGHR